MTIDNQKLQHVHITLSKAYKKHPHRFVDDAFLGEPFGFADVTVVQLGTLFMFSRSRGQSLGTIQTRIKDGEVKGFVYKAAQHTVAYMAHGLTLDSSPFTSMMDALDELFEHIDRSASNA